MLFLSVMSVVLNPLEKKKILLVFLLLKPFICLKQMGLYALCHLVNILNNSQISSREDDVIFTEKTKNQKCVIWP